MRFDVAIIGAGTAGAGAAWQCARRGLRVVCLDARPLAEAGARWVNGVARWLLGAAEIPLPEGDELRADDGRFHLIAGWGPERVIMGERGVLELDMRKLVARLQGMAGDAGAELRGGVRVLGLEGDRLDTSDGPLRAEVFVDASGLASARLIPTPAIPRQHICAAAQAVHAVADLPAARAYFERHAVAEGESLCFAGIAGGYSILNVRLEGDELSILTGSVPADGHLSGRALLDRFVAEQPWIGPELFGGARAIPIRRPFDRLAHGRVALLGDAGSQVFSAHGSGIGLGLLAGRMLAEALADGRGVLHYQRRFHREQGGVLAAYDVFRRYSQRLSPSDLATLMRAGLLDAASATAGTSQRLPQLDLELARTKLAALIQAPRHALALGRVGARMAAAAAAYRAYPDAPARLPAWSRAIARVVGDPQPDLSGS
ncbi:MAG: FAD-dependent oxidoreductase [Enhygromyxa sp.]